MWHWQICLQSTHRRVITSTVMFWKVTPERCTCKCESTVLYSSKIVILLLNRLQDLVIYSYFYKLKWLEVKRGSLSSVLKRSAGYSWGGSAYSSWLKGFSKRCAKRTNKGGGDETLLIIRMVHRVFSSLPATHFDWEGIKPGEILMCIFMKLKLLLSIFLH